MKTFRIGLMLFLCFSLVQIYPQFNDIDCGSSTTLKNSSIFATIGGKYKPSANASGQFFRILFVFAQFQSDNETIPGWPKGSLPDWASNVIDNVPASTYRPYTLSDYFKRMSRNQFDFIGDIHPNIITVQNNKSYKLANVDVINTLKTQITDFKRYDNWGFANNAFYFNERNADNYLDMVIIVYRWGGDWLQLAGGIAELGFSGDLTMPDGVKINGAGTNVLGSGMTSKIGKWTDAFRITAHFAHEYGHYLFGGGHTSMGGLMMGYPWDYNGTYAMNAWERERLGYITLSNMYNGQPKTIYDYVTEHDSIRINTNSSDPNEYIILENHQRLNYFDQVIRGGALEGAMDPNATLGKGLYVWYYKNGSTYPPTVWSIQADGGFEWQFVEYRTLVGWGGPGQPDPIKPVLDRGTSYRNLPNNIYNEIGRCDRNRLYFQSPTGWTEEYRWWDRDAITNNWIISREPLGDETDAFKIGYNDQITPWSNPSSTKTSGATNISLKITNESNNTIELMYYNTYQGALNLPPSKPQNLHLTQDVNHHPVLTWEANIEPDLNGYRVYKKLTTSSGTMTSYIFTSSSSYTDYDFIITNPHFGTDQAEYWIVAVDYSNKLSIDSDHLDASSQSLIQWKLFEDMTTSSVITDYELNQNFPNPFNPSTVINYAVKDAGLVKIKVFDILGSEIAVLVNENKESGYHSIEFNASGLPSGVYVCTFQAGSFTASKKLILLK